MAVPLRSLPSATRSSMSHTSSSPPGWSAASFIRAFLFFLYEQPQPCACLAFNRLLVVVQKQVRQNKAHLLHSWVVNREPRYARTIRSFCECSLTRAGECSSDRDSPVR